MRPARLNAALLALALLCPAAAHALAPTDTATPSTTVTPSPSASPTPTVTATAVCGSTFGQTSFYSGAGVINSPGNGSAWLQGTRYALPVSGTANQLSVFVSPAGSYHFRLGLYSDGSNYPRQLLAQSEEQVCISGWNNVIIPLIYLTPGNYWIVVLADGPMSTWMDSLAGGSNLLLGGGYAPFGSMPNLIANGDYNITIAGGLRFMYASYCPGPPIFYTPTVTPTATPTPILFLHAGAVGKAVLGPVPVAKGAPLCLYLAKPALSSRWEIYNLAGQRVSSLNFSDAAQACWDTSKVAPGLYLARVRVDYADGSSGTVLQKVVVVK